MMKMHSRLLTSVLAVCALFAVSEAHATPVKVYQDPSFIDVAGGAGSEGLTIAASLTSLGHTVTTFTGTSASAWTAALSGTQVLVIPEQERGTIYPSLAAGAVSAIQSYVAGGGGLIVSLDYGTNFLNSVFGFSTSINSVSTSTIGSVAGTEFVGGPATLPAPSFTAGLLTSSLPIGSTSIYASGAYSSVALMNYGAGQIVYLGWDWFNAAPMGSQDSGWLSVLDDAVCQVASSCGVSAGVPAPGSLPIVLIGLVAVAYTQRRRFIA